MCVECDECKKPCDPSCPVRPLYDVEKMSILGNGEPEKGTALVDRLCEVIRAAREKHPEFAIGEYQALGRIGAEYGELVQTIEKNEGEDRQIEEAFHTVAVLFRFILGEHKQLVQELK